MKRLLMMSLILLTTMSRCFAGISNAYTYNKNYATMESFYEALEKQDSTLVIHFKLMDGESMFGEPSIDYHQQTNLIYGYRYQTVHHGLTYKNFVGMTVENSRESGGRLFSGEHMDEEIIHDGLVIRTALYVPSASNEILVFLVDFYFEMNGVGYYGYIYHHNEISENFDKQLIIDYVIDLYESNHS